MRAVDLIVSKRMGGELTAAELSFLVRGYTTGEIPDYQMSAWLMAVCWRGMTPAETADLTLAMAASGHILDLHDIAPIVADKHSTGGVGDGTTLLVAPIVAACGVPVGKLAGRGLGFTGGTLDKLEAIPGFTVNLGADQFRRQLGEIGIVISAQSADLAPADGMIYALRDVTGTVASIPLIASSIMSKKIAGGADAIVLDVKVGRGAFMRTASMGRDLARLMIRIGEATGRRTRAILSAMDQPLGNAVGDALEVRQAVVALQGKGPSDLVELSLCLAANLLVLARRAPDFAAGLAIAREAMESGQAYEKLGQLVRAQHGDQRMLEQPDLVLPRAQTVVPIVAPRSGYVQHLDALAVGRAVAALGGGRSRKGDAVDPAVGVTLRAKMGERVVRGDALAFLHTREGSGLSEAAALVSAAYRFSTEPPPERMLILETIREVDPLAEVAR